MSSTPGRKRIDPNETEAQKMIRILNGRVSKAANALDRVAAAAVVLHAGCKELGIDPSTVISGQVAPFLAEKYNKAMEQLQQGTAEKPSFSLTL